MKSLLHISREIFKGGRTANKVVTPSGFSSWPSIVSAAIMAFLVVFTLTLASTAGQLANRWSDGLAGTATVRISAPVGGADAELEAALETLTTTPGVQSAEPIPLEDQLAVLSPWLGNDIPADLLPIPRMISVNISGNDFDKSALEARLKAEAPNAIFDDHSRWRQPLIASATRLRTISLVSSGLVWVIFIFMIVLATHASLAANARLIATLRTIGATDLWIISGFVRRQIMRVFLGTLVGLCFGVGAVMFLAQFEAGGGVFSEVNFVGGLVLRAILIAFVAVFVAFLATTYSSRRYLNRLS